MTITELCWMSQRDINKVSKTMIATNVRVARGWLNASCLDNFSNLPELDMARLGFLLSQLDRRKKARLAVKGN